MDRSQVRVLDWRRDKPRAHGIGDDVSRIRSRIGVVSQDAVKITLLPKSEAEARPVHVTRSLFRHLCEPSQIRALVDTFDQKVDVIRHEAVRKNVEGLVLRSTLNLRNRLRYDGRILEDRATVEDAERQEILGLANV